MERYDFKTIENVVFALRGELASVLGREAAVNDYYVHLMNFWQMVKDRYETDVADDIKSVCNGYAAGINKFLTYFFCFSQFNPKSFCR